MDKVEGLKEIEEAKWVKDDYGWMILTVHGALDKKIVAQLSMRPEYCDRGHIQLLIDGHLEIDNADSFPRFFFSAKEANDHVRTFLKWRLWKERTYEHTMEELCVTKS